MRPTVPSFPFVSILTVTALVAAEAAAQRGGPPRRPEAVLERVGAFFVDGKLDVPPTAPADQKQPDLLSALPFANTAKNAGHRCVVYLYDGAADDEKQRQFERALFQDDLGIALRFFECVRLDASGANAAPLQQRYGEDLPLFAVHDSSGQLVGSVSMAGFRAGGSDLEKLLQKAVAKDSKLSLAAFVKQYGSVVRDIEQVEQKRSQIDERDKKVKADDKQKRVAIERERKELARREEKVMADERQLLEQAMLPPRPEESVRLGGRGWGGGRGDRGGDPGGHPGGDPGRGDPEPGRGGRGR